MPFFVPNTIHYLIVRMIFNTKGSKNFLFYTCHTIIIKTMNWNKKKS